MGMYMIKSGKLSLRIRSLGAELISLRDCTTGQSTCGTGILNTGSALRRCCFRWWAITKTRKYATTGIFTTCPSTVSRGTWSSN